MKFYKLLISLMLLATLAGCGQMGPLYLPVETTPAAPAPVTKAVDSDIKAVADQPIPLQKPQPAAQTTAKPTSTQPKKIKAR